MRRQWRTGFRILGVLCVFASQVLVASQLLAQHYNFRAYTEGLGNLNINSISQDGAGYLWLGTENGLYRFDGTHFREYEEEEGLPSHLIERVYYSPGGTVWVGTMNGLFFERHDGHFGQVPFPRKGGEFRLRGGTVISADINGGVVVADRSGAYRVHPEGSDRWAAEPLNLEGSDIWSVLVDSHGSLWYGCDRDLCKLEDGKTRHMGAALHLPADEWRHLLLTRSGEIWIHGNTHAGAIPAARDRYESHDLPESTASLHYIDMAEDRNGHVAATQGRGFEIFENGSWHRFSELNGLPHYNLSAIFVDREGSFWFSVVGHGLLHWSGRDTWEGFTASDGLSNDLVWSYMQDRRGRRWIATESGIDWMPAGSTRARPWHSGSIPTARAVALTEDAQGAIWAGREVGGLIRIDPETLAGKEWKLSEIYRLVADGHNHVWVGTSHGLYVMDANGSAPPKLVEDKAFTKAGQFIHDLVIGPGDQLWIAADQGVLYLDKSGWHSVDTGHKYGKPEVMALDREGNLWLAGDFDGVVRLRMKNGRMLGSTLVTRPQVLSDQIVALYVDSRGWVWAGQDAGLSVFDGRGWKSFTQDDGLIWDDINSFSLAEDRDGSMWIGTSGGLSHMLRPEAISSEKPASLTVSQVLFGQNEIQDGAEVKWNPDPLIVLLGSLSFHDENRIRVRYRLLGLQPEWQETSERNLRYPRLSPGSYRFQAEAVDARSGAISDAREFAFTITPRWWQSLQLKLGVLLAMLLLLLLIWNMRVKTLKTQKRSLEEAVKQRTVELEHEKAELLVAREKLRRDAERDSLTELWNRRVITERLSREVDHSRRDKLMLSVMIVDLDHFKRINDTYGHQAGDRVLKEVGKILARSVRSYDWVGRYGGEEFMLIIPNTGYQGACLRAEELRLAIEGLHVEFGGNVVKVTASFGVASGHPQNMESTIRIADAALYEAKKGGRNCVRASEIQVEETTTAG